MAKSHAPDGRMSACTRTALRRHRRYRKAGNAGPGRSMGVGNQVGEANLRVHDRVAYSVSELWPALAAADGEFGPALGLIRGAYPSDYIVEWERLSLPRSAARMKRDPEFRSQSPQTPEELVKFIFKSSERFIAVIDQTRSARQSSEREKTPRQLKKKLRREADDLLAANLIALNFLAFAVADRYNGASFATVARAFLH